MNSHEFREALIKKFISKYPELPYSDALEFAEGGLIALCKSIEKRRKEQKMTKEELEDFISKQQEEILSFNI